MKAKTTVNHEFSEIWGIFLWVAFVIVYVVACKAYNHNPLMMDDIGLRSLKQARPAGNFNGQGATGNFGQQPKTRASGKETS